MGKVTEAICQLEGTELSFSRHYEVEREAKESDRDYEERTWRNRLHTDDKGIVFIPPMAFKLSLAIASQRLGTKIPGKRGATYTKHFKSGVMVTKGLSLGIHRDDVEGEELFVPSDGKTGGGSRVTKIFPLIRSWKGEVTYIIMDPVISEDVFKETLEECGSFVGLLRFRPPNNGYYGRFQLMKLTWKAMKL